MTIDSIFHIRTRINNVETLDLSYNNNLDIYSIQALVSWSCGDKERILNKAKITVSMINKINHNIRIYNDKIEKMKNNSPLIKNNNDILRLLNPEHKSILGRGTVDAISTRNTIDTIRFNMLNLDDLQKIRDAFKLDKDNVLKSGFPLPYLKKLIVIGCEKIKNEEYDIKSLINAIPNKIDLIINRTCYE